MLDGLLAAGLEHPEHAHRVRHMADHAHPVPFGGVEDRRIAAPRQSRVDLHEIVPNRLLGHDFTIGLFGCLDHLAARPDRGLAVQNGSRGEYGRAESLAGHVLLPPLERFRESPHAADRRDSVRHVDRPVLGVVQVHVHVDQSGHEPEASPLDSQRAARHASRGLGSHGLDPVATDHDVLVLEDPIRVHGHDIDVDEDERAETGRLMPAGGGG